LAEGTERPISFLHNLPLNQSGQIDFSYEIYKINLFVAVIHKIILSPLRPYGTAQDCHCG
jgi:hypothetical protein